MNKNNVIQRVLVFFIGIPAIISAIFFLPHQSHLFFNIVAVVASFIASTELINMFTAKGIEQKIKIQPFFSLPLPITAYIVVRFNIEYDLFSLVLTSMIILILLLAISTRVSGADFKDNITFIATSLFLLIYPGYFISYIIRLSEFTESSLIICLFILVVFLNDSGAWLLGVLFGKNNRGVVKVSPNKSAMGFLGGALGTYLFMWIARMIIPGLDAMPIPVYIVVSAIIALCTITGDLIESAIKRSSNVKDSGDVVMGRGGLLDSIDSLLLVAPIFYYLMKRYVETGM